VLTSLRAELLVLRKRLAVWAFVLLPAVYTLLSSYVSPYVYYRTASTGLVQGFTPAQFLPAILPGQFMMVSPRPGQCRQPPAPSPHPPMCLAGLPQPSW
jgi:hypothetical protein